MGRYLPDCDKSNCQELVARQRPHTHTYIPSYIVVLHKTFIITYIVPPPPPPPPAPKAPGVPVSPTKTCHCAPRPGRATSKSALHRRQRSDKKCQTRKARSTGALPPSVRSSWPNTGTPPYRRFPGPPPPAPAETGGLTLGQPEPLATPTIGASEWQSQRATHRR